MSNPTPLIRCPECKFLDTGKYCSHCGSELTGKPSQPLWAHLDSFLKIKAAREYLKVYLWLLVSPTKNTLAAFNELSTRQVRQFFAHGIAFSVFIIAVAVGFSDPLSSIVLSLILGIYLTIYAFVFYRLARRKFPIQRSLRQFLSLNALYLGFTLPLWTLADTIWPGTLDEPGPLVIILSRPLAIYTIRLQRRFFGFHIRTLLFYGLIANFIAGIALAIVFTLLGIDLNQR
jgi:hypothetical protein